MAQKKKASSPAKAPTEKTSNVTRIKATDTSTKKAPAAPKSVSATKKKAKDTKKIKKTVDPSERGYFRGAWYELSQVRWPNRRTTWALTLAVILFTLFFVVLIVLLDYSFQWVFDQILG